MFRKVGLGTGAVLALVVLLFAGGPLNVLEVAYSAVVTAVPTGVPVTSTATATPCAGAAATATPTPIPTGDVPAVTGSPTGVPIPPTATPCAAATNTPAPTATATTATSGGGGGSGAPASPSGTALGASGAPVVTLSNTSSASGGVQVVGGAAGPNTGVADIPANLDLTQFLASSLPGAPNGAALLPPIDPSSLTGNAPAPITASVSAATGGIIIAGNAALIIPPAALAAVPGGQATFAITPATSVPIPGGPAAFSPNGTLLSITITDKSGAPVTTFPALIPIELKYNAADVGQAHGDPATLSAAYVIDGLSPFIENPLGFPAGTFVIFPSNHTSLNTTTGTITVTTQAIGSTISVVTNPVGYVQTLTADAPELSSFADNAQTFGTKPQFTFLQVVEPQIGTRLLVLDPDTGNYTYINATDVGPSGPPPGKAPAAVVRAAREGAG